MFTGNDPRISGERGEKYFENYCKSHNALPIRIKNAGRKTKTGTFIRGNQICDYIVAFNYYLFLVDVKYMKASSINRSFFIKESGRSTSTHKQVDHFLNLYRNQKIMNCGFFIIDSKSTDNCYFIKSMTLDLIDKEKPRAKIDMYLNTIEPKRNVFKEAI